MLVSLVMLAVLTVGSAGRDVTLEILVELVALLELGDVGNADRVVSGCDRQSCRGKERQKAKERNRREREIENGRERDR